MPSICYEIMKMADWKSEIAKKAIEIIGEFKRQGYDLTLRQVYYQFVARDLLPQKWADPVTGSTNNQRSYKNLGTILGDARMCGMMDWDDMVDRTRERSGNQHWDSPAHIIRAVAAQYLIDLWEGQKYRPEVWVEKDALEGVVGVACRRLDIPYFSCRGYTSLTSIWEGSQVLAKFAQSAIPVILHLGDHDPSGIDMSRDIEERVRLFMGKTGKKLIFKRLALNMDQIEQYNPPPNPVKLTDSRSNGYTGIHGDECWELDALDPRVLDQLITDEVLELRNDSLYNKRKKIQDKEKALLQATSDHWAEVAEDMQQYVENDGD